MDWLKNIAPTLATAFGGPLAGAAVLAISEALGVSDATQENIKGVLTSGKLTPEQLASLQQAEVAFKTRVMELGVDIERIAATDRDSARKMQIETLSNAPSLLAGIVVIAWAVVQGVILFHVIEDSMRELVIRVLGTLDAALLLVLNFYFGSSASSRDKDRLISTITKQ